MRDNSRIAPDLQGCIVCEDVRQEINGMQTIVGVVNVIPAPVVPITLMKLCVWTRWCGGMGKFRQRTRIVSGDDVSTIVESEVEFELRVMEQHATNVHCFGGVKFEEFGYHFLELYLDEEFQIRIPVNVVQLVPHAA